MTDNRFWQEKDVSGWENERPVHAYMHGNYSYGMHSHQFYEINVVIRGKGRHHIEEADLAAQTGDVFVIPPRMEHCYTSSEGIDVFHILLSNRFIARYGEELEAIPGYKALFDIEPLVRRSAGKRYNLHLSYDRLDELKRELDLIVGAQTDGLYSFATLLTLALVSKFCIQFYGKVSSGEVKSEESFEIIRILDYINNNLENKLTLEELCAFSGMSKATLGRTFRQVLRYSPMEYVLMCRAERAKNLMDKGEGCSKSEIAQMCGFYDSSHMNRNLKKFGFSDREK